MTTVLAIDDAPESIMSVRVAARGWRVLAATTGEEARQILSDQIDSVDVVVLDLFLPDVDGATLCNEIRSMAPALPIIVLTGHPERLRQLAPLGIAAHIIKPAESLEIRRVLSEVLGIEPPTDTLHRALRLQLADHRSAVMHEDDEERDELAIIRGATFGDLDLTRVEQHIQGAIARRGYGGPDDAVSYLRLHECVIGSGPRPTPTLLGLIAFGYNPNRFLLSEVDIARFTSLNEAPDATDERQTIRGTVFELIERATLVLEALNPHRSRIQGAERVDRHMYHPGVLRELLTNAVMHRSYQQRGAGIQIKLFPNRLEVVSPGGLPPGVRPDNLRTARALRNIGLAELLRNAGLVERFGMGYKFIYQVLAEWGLDEPKVVDEGTFLTVIIPARQFGAEPMQPASPIPVHIRGRQRTILLKIEELGGHVKRSDLQPLFMVTIRTLQRDLDKLEQEGLIRSEGNTNMRTYHRVK